MFEFEFTEPAAGSQNYSLSLASFPLASLSSSLSFSSSSPGGAAGRSFPVGTGSSGGSRGTWPEVVVVSASAAWWRSIAWRRFVLLRARFVPVSMPGISFFLPRPRPRLPDLPPPRPRRPRASDVTSGIVTGLSATRNVLVMFVFSLCWQLLEHLVLPYCPALLFVHCYCRFCIPVLSANEWMNEYFRPLSHHVLCESCMETFGISKLWSWMFNKSDASNEDSQKMSTCSVQIIEIREKNV